MPEKLSKEDIKELERLRKAQRRKKHKDEPLDAESRRIEEEDRAKRVKRSNETSGMMGGGRVKKSKGYMGGGKTKGSMRGGKQPKGMKTGGKLKMVKNAQGKDVPFFAADGVGKMSSGRKVPSTKGYFMGGKTKGMSKGGKTGGKTMARGSGAARPQVFRKDG